MSFVFLVLGGSVLWLFPLWLFHAKNARLGNFDQRGWPKGRNLVLTVLDVVRAALGANLLARGLPGLPIPPGAPGWLGEVWLAVALAVALAAQTLSWRDEDYVRAPVAFLLGAMLVLIHPMLTVIGLLMAVGTALAVRAWSAGFIGAAMALGGVGFVYTAHDYPRAMLLGVAAGTPAIITVLAGRHMGAPRN